MRFTPDKRGISEYLKTSPELRQELVRRARLGLAHAETVVPKDTGKLAASGHVVENAGIGGIKHDRMEARVDFDEDYAASVEFGTGRRKGRTPVPAAFLRSSVTIIERG